MFRIILSILIFVCIVLYTINTFILQDQDADNLMEIILVTQSNISMIGQNVKAAYESVLEEEGVPFKWITHGELWRKTPAEILKHNNTIIFPDYLTENIPYEFSVWVEDFVDLGGNVLIVYNCGTKHETGSYRGKAVFTRLLGLNYITYNKYQSLAFQLANVRFKDKSSIDFLEIPCGKLDQTNTLTGYQYGQLSYPVAKVDVNYVDNKDILTYSVSADGKILPNTFRKKSGLGNVMFANLPLGYLKAYGTDDLLLRSYLRAFLFKISSVPHIDRAPYHKGGIVLNWHIDDWRERTNFYLYQKKRIIRKNLPQSIHITAGDYLFEPGDTLGFNAAKYPNVVRDMTKFGTIGSHGGWAHNWFTSQLKNKKLTNEDIAYYVDINSKILSLITNYDIREYAAPNGMHPQPFLTKHLEKNNYLAYYYPGDLGSEPNRTFFKGKMVSDKVIAFPVMPYRDFVSVQEIADNQISSSEYEEWLMGTLKQTERNRTLCLIYNHIYDFATNPQYEKPFIKFLDQVESDIENGQLIVETMSYFAKFIQRFLKTEYKFILKKKENFMSVELKNSEGLQGISVAIPKNMFRKPPGAGFYVEEDRYFYYAIITDNVYEKNIICHHH